MENQPQIFKILIETFKYLSPYSHFTFHISHFSFHIISQKGDIDILFKFFGIPRLENLFNLVGVAFTSLNLN